MIRFFFRVLAGLTLGGAVVMAVLDATRSVAASKLVMTPLAESWEAGFPAALSAFQDAVRTWLGDYMWDPVMLAVLHRPGWLVLAALAFLLYAVGHRPQRTRSDWA